MAIGKSREELYELFKTGAKPSGADFQDLIDSAVNSSDDGIEKPLGDDTPLKINARGDTENLLDFYAGKNPTWRINQKPTQETPGLNFATATGDSSRLFIDSSTGKVGLSTTVPKAKLHIQQNGSEDALRIEDAGTDSTPLVVNAEGNVGIGKPDPAEKLDVQGNTAISGGLTISETLKAQVLRVDSHSRTSHINGDGILYRKGGQFYLTVDDHFYIRDSASSTASNNVKFHFNTNDGKLTLNDTNSSLEVKGTGASSFAGSLKIDGKLTLPGAQQIVFEDADTTNNLKLQLWRGFGLGINDATLFYAANGNHSWRDNNGTNERMKLTTTANGGLEVKGTGTSSFAGSVGIGTNTPRAKLEVNGDIWAYKHGIYFLDKNQGQADGMGVRYGANAKLEIFSDQEIAFVESDHNTTAASIDVNNGTIKAASFQIGGEKIVESDIAILKKLAKGNLIIRLQEQNGDKFLDSGQITVHNGNQGDWQKWKVLIT